VRIDFYLLPDADEAKRQIYVCRLVDKAYRLGHTVWLHTASDEHARALDERLWTFSQPSFVPHERAGSGEPDCPVVVGEGKQPASPRDLLVNEATDVPTFVDRFARVAEVVNQDDGVRRRSRARYAAYRDQGYALHHYRVS